MNRRNIKGLTLSELEEFALSIGERKFRGRQLFEWLYVKEAPSFADMTSLSKAFREELSSAATIESIGLDASSTSALDRTVKYLFALHDGKKIESVLIPPRTAFAGKEAPAEDEQTRLTLCLSTQAGCPLDCAFCATGTMGLLRNLDAGEIIDQFAQVRKLSARKITNLVFMGMGEPLMNYDNLLRAIEILQSGFGMPARRMTVSTAGWVPGIDRLAGEKRRIKLAVSLHSLDDATRTALMPVNRKFPLAALLDSVAAYYRAVKQRVTFEYILFDGLNDREEDLRRLVALAGRIPCKINLIPFHSIGFTHPTGLAATLRPTPRPRIEEFASRLRNAHLTVFVRSSSGEDIAAACGQLAVASGRERPKRRTPPHSHAHRPQPA